jgi:hypothetical protein
MPIDSVKRAAPVGASTSCLEPNVIVVIEPVVPSPVSMTNVASPVKDASLGVKQ